MIYLLIMTGKKLCNSAMCLGLMAVIILLLFFFVF